MTQMTDQQSDGTAGNAVAGTDSPGAADPYLAEWDRSRSHANSPIPTELLPVIRFAEGQMVEKVKAEIDKEVETAVSSITSQDEFKDVPKRLARGFLEAWALENPEFKTAYEQRKANPRGWQSALAAAGQGFAEDMKGIGSKGGNLRSDVEAAKAAVRGTSSTQPPPPKQKSAAELRQMSDGEFRRYKATLAARGR